MLSYRWTGLTETSRLLYRQGFWANPSRNLVIQVRTRHVHTLISYPRTFGFAGKEEIRLCYREYGEKPGTENHARRELICRTVQSGWIRIRRYPRRGYYTVNCPNLSDTTAGFLGRLFLDLSRGIRILPGTLTLIENDPDFRVRVDIPGLEESWCTVADLVSLVDPDLPPLQWREERGLESGLKA